MASLVARALIEDHPQQGRRDPRRGIDRILLTSFWRPAFEAHPAVVISITECRSGVGNSPSRR